jgi:hypothetical protein
VSTGARLRAGRTSYVQPSCCGGLAFARLVQANPSDPFVVIVLALAFIASIFFLHIAAKIVRVFMG